MAGAHPALCLDVFHGDNGYGGRCKCAIYRYLFLPRVGPGFQKCLLIIARSIVPFRFHGLTTIGTIFFLFDILLFVFNIAMVSLRFRLYLETFKASFLHPTESLFVPASVGMVRNYTYEYLSIRTGRDRSMVGYNC